MQVSTEAYLFRVFFIFLLVFNSLCIIGYLDAYWVINCIQKQYAIRPFSGVFMINFLASTIKA